MREPSRRYLTHLTHSSHSLYCVAPMLRPTSGNMHFSAASTCISSEEHSAFGTVKGSSWLGACNPPWRTPAHLTKSAASLARHRQLFILKYSTAVSAMSRNHQDAIVMFFNESNIWQDSSGDVYACFIFSGLGSVLTLTTAQSCF